MALTDYIDAAAAQFIATVARCGRP